MHIFVETLNARFGGILSHGPHEPGLLACVHEVASIARGGQWSARPAGMPDLRLLNDALWSDDAARTAALVPVAVALWDWEAWPSSVRAGWVQRLVDRSMREILPNALRVAGLWAEAGQCSREGTIEALRAIGASLPSHARLPWSSGVPWSVGECLVLMLEKAIDAHVPPPGTTTYGNIIRSAITASRGIACATRANAYNQAIKAGVLAAEAHRLAQCAAHYAADTALNHICGIWAEEAK